MRRILLLLCILITNNLFSLNFFIVFPRCGNNWMLYQMVNLSHKRCIGYGGERYWRNQFCFKGVNIKDAFPVSYGEKSVLVYHFFSCKKIDELFIKKNPKEDRLILLIRDYKECLPRQYNYDLEAIKDQIMFLQRDKYKPKLPYEYFDNLYYFDAYQGPKLLVYYDDLMKNPKVSLLKIFSFLGESTQYFDSFYNHLEQHKQRSLNLYVTHGGGSRSRGKDDHYHSKKLGYRICFEIDELVRINHPILWKKYLKKYSFNIK
jgi:hypothetical protein